MWLNYSPLSSKLKLKKEKKKKKEKKRIRANQKRKVATDPLLDLYGHR
jgi:hypothetical protein